MAKYVFRITTKTAACNSSDGSICIERRVYISDCKNMFDALRKSSKYAGLQLDDANSDYISDVSVERIGEEEEDA